MLWVIRNLRAIAECFHQGTALPAELAIWLERSLREFLDHRCSSLDEALGLRFAKGGVPWWLEEAMRMRNAALRELAERYLADETTNARAARIRATSERYAATGWLVDREHDTLPARYGGTPKELLWRAFKSGAPMPLGERRLRSILVGCGTPPAPAVRAEAPAPTESPAAPCLDDPNPRAA